jgi:hypothetical protein
MAKKAHLESYLRDKAVQDNIVESWLCVDCGMNTHPVAQTAQQPALSLP